MTLNTDHSHTRRKSKPLFDRIRANLLEGHFAPGQWLKQAELEERYQASRSEVRAALSSLAEKGLVEYNRNRGFRVFERSPKDVQEIVQMITVLEAAAAPSMVENVTRVQIGELTALAEAFDALIASGSHAELRLLNYRFHSQLNGLNANKLIARTIQNLRECCISGPFGRYTTYEGLQASSREHFAIISALKAKNTAALRSLLIEHGSHTA